MEQKHQHDHTNPTGLAQFLGWFSVGLGAAELLAPRRLSAFIGAPQSPTLVRSLGLREIASGAAILLGKGLRRGGLWSRVGGDVIDLALLAAAHRSRHADRSRLSTATAAVAGVTALDVLCSKAESQLHTNGSRAFRTEQSVIIERSPEELYRYWRRVENLPHLMPQIRSVRSLDAKRSHWTMETPAGAIEWDAVITEDIPAKRISWRSVENANLSHAGVVRFDPAPGNRGTLLHAEIEFIPPAGRLGAAAAALFGRSPSQSLSTALFRFKQLMETGEIATTEGQPSGREQGATFIDRRFGVQEGARENQGYSIGI